MRNKKLQTKHSTEERRNDSGYMLRLLTKAQAGMSCEQSRWGEAERTCAEGQGVERTWVGIRTCVLRAEYFEKKKVADNLLLLLKRDYQDRSSRMEKGISIFSLICIVGHFKISVSLLKWLKCTNKYWKYVLRIETKQ